MHTCINNPTPLLAADVADSACERYFRCCRGGEGGGGNQTSPFATLGVTKVLVTQNLHGLHNDTIQLDGTFYRIQGRNSAQGKT